MNLRATLRRKGATTVITLAGVMDAHTAPTFRQELERAADPTVKQVVFDLTQVSYLSSGGLRMLAYARQKLPAGVRIAVVGANETIQRTILLVGYHYCFEIIDRLPGWRGEGAV